MDFLRGFWDGLRREMERVGIELLHEAARKVQVPTCGHDNARWISQHARTLLCDECDWYERMEDKAQDFMWWAVRR